MKTVTLTSPGPAVERHVEGLPGPIKLLSEHWPYEATFDEIVGSNVVLERGVRGAEEGLMGKGRNNKSTSSISTSDILGLLATDLMDVHLCQAV